MWQSTGDLVMVASGKKVNRNKKNKKIKKTLFFSKSTLEDTRIIIKDVLWGTLDYAI